MQVGLNIEAKLVGGNMQEAFCHLKGWYRAATETQSKPCYHTIEHQTLERVDLYARRTRTLSCYISSQLKSTTTL